MDLLNILPGVANPKTRLNFKDRLKWTGIGLLLFYLMGFIHVAGAQAEVYDRFKQISVLMGSKFGTLATLGIGPIVTASILLQVLVGSKIINWDMNTKEGRSKFQGTQKLLAIAFCFLEGFAYVLFGAVPASSPSLIPLVGLQIALGGLIILFLDEVIMKWGIGSGVSLFIAAGVSERVFIGLFSPFEKAGAIAQLIYGFSTANFVLVGMAVTTIAATILIFAICLYAQSIKVEIPLAFSQLRGFGRRWPLNFFYTSNIPVILAAALIINISMVGAMLDSKGISILGKFDESGTPISGLAYYLTPPHNVLQNFLFGLGPVDVVRIFTYLVFLTILCVVFSIFWVETANMGPEAVADQISNIGMQIPGFRKDKRILIKILSKYIYPLTVLGAIAVGILAALADFTGALGTGTGILLTVMILYNFYERISQQYIEDMNPAVRKFFK
ncbi:MAG TPA: preprotein translocase subunit SecY [Candidatus Aenigmarchaeota archaeon]|nr:MAG: preprotein translocase subunit SecY [Candidatus Aenigmarchaeota archaeon]HDI06406.1 preprotein translocase subunit SecY [Candidatus Aenigmarchaeota archaeon]